VRNVTPFSPDTTPPAPAACGFAAAFTRAAWAATEVFVKVAAGAAAARSTIRSNHTP
jgi:hypothetical protein